MKTIDLTNKNHRYVFENLKKYFGSDIDDVMLHLNKTYNPLRAFFHLETIISNIKSFKIIKENFQILFNIISFSPFLFSIIRKDPDFYLTYLFNSSALQKTCNENYFLKELKNITSTIRDINNFKKELRRFKKREFLRIGTQDICKLKDVESIMLQLSDLASAFLKISSEWLSVNIFKSITIEDFFILGMGKFGGRELNFSSDIDLIYFFKDNNKKFVIINFFETLTKIINEVTDEGFVFRVDLRLRPDGINGPIAISVSNGIFYYENFGRFWERAALIKARPVAGNIESGWEFLKELDNFIYRRSIDFRVSREIFLMKEKIKQSINLEEFKNNIKLGKGGIREIEFIIQMIQLIFGGKYREIRVKNSLKFLRIIKENFNFLKKDEVEFFIEGYKFLRQLEHKIQILYEKQVHTIPKDIEELNALAKYFNFPSVENFLTYQEKLRNRINEIFTNFFTFKEEKRELNDIVLLIVENDKISAYEKLKSKGVSEPENIIENLNLLFQNIPDETREYVSTVFSYLFERIDSFARKDIIINYFIKLLERFKLNKGYLHFIIKNDHVISFLMNIFSKSNYLSEIIFKYKETFEEIFFSDFIGVLKQPEDFVNELEELIDNSFSYEDIFEKVRIFKHKEDLRIGINFLNKTITLRDTLQQLSFLAESILKVSANMLMKIIEKKFGTIDSDFAIIGLGKLGSMDLNFSSDLDIILIFENDTTSIKGLSSQEFFSKFLQRLINFLTIRTSNGFVYEIDTRLRPSGNAGALVTSFDSFKEYHLNRSAMWEVLALLKGRFIAGNKELGGKVESFLSRYITELEISPDDISEILRIRERIEKELGKEAADIIDIKNGRGGIIDIEFLVQILLLQNKIFEGNIFKGIDLLYEKNMLTKQEKDLLAFSYEFFRYIENIIRLTLNQHTDKIEKGNELFDFNKIVEIKEKVRKLFNQKTKGGLA